MKRILFSIIFSVAGFLAFAEPEFVRINVSDANIRQEPTASSARLVWNGDMLDWSTLKTKQAYHERKGTVVQVLERTQGWTKIYFNSQAGWVSNTLIEEVAPAKITKMRFEEVVEQNGGADYKSFVWLDDDHVLFTQHGGEGTQEILFGKFSKGTLLLYGNPLKVYTNLSSGFGIEKMGEDPYAYFNVNYGDDYKKEFASAMDISKLTPEEADRVSDLFDTHADYERYYFLPAPYEQNLMYSTCDVSLEGEESGAPINYTVFDAFLSDQNGEYSNVRDTPNGKVISRIPTNRVMQLSLLSQGNGWWKITSYWETGNEYYDDIIGGMIHYSCLGVSTRNYGGQKCTLRKALDAQSQGVYHFMSEMTLRPKQLSDDCNWVLVETFDKKISGWIECFWICGNPVTNCI